MLPCRITLLRKSKGLNQSQLAKKLHVSPSTIGMYEQGRRTPNIDILIQMSKIFNVSLDYLLTGSEYIPSSESRNAYAAPTLRSCHNCCCRKILDIIRENTSPHEPGQA